MNPNAHIFKELHGKTIERTEYSDDAYEDTWVTLHFTDGSIYKISAKATYADETWLDIERG